MRRIRSISHFSTSPVQIRKTAALQLAALCCCAESGADKRVWVLRQGGIILGIGGDNSPWASGTFYGKETLSCASASADRRFVGLLIFLW